MNRRLTIYYYVALELIIYKKNELELRNFELELRNFELELRNFEFEVSYKKIKSKN